MPGSSGGGTIETLGDRMRGIYWIVARPRVA